MSDHRSGPAGEMAGRRDTGICGSCGRKLGPGESYCRYCGTKRGEGSFQPSRNMPGLVYGPPMTIAYRCSACGHRLVLSVLGVDSSKYCPICGKKTLEMVSRHHGFAAKGQEEPEILKKPEDAAGAGDSAAGRSTGGHEGTALGREKRPVPFTEQQAIDILACRRVTTGAFSGAGAGPGSQGAGAISGSGAGHRGQEAEAPSDEEAVFAMRSAGLPVPEKADYVSWPVTEEEIEGLTLAKTILSARGDRLYGHARVLCPACGSGLVAALRYRAADGRRTLVPVQDGALTVDTPAQVSIQDLGSGQAALRKPAYICLTCGLRFRARREIR